PDRPSSYVLLFFYCFGLPQDLHSFPTRRSSDLSHRHRLRRLRGTRPCPQQGAVPLLPPGSGEPRRRPPRRLPRPPASPPPLHARDRKSTRLNSSHVKNSYAVFCLKKKTTRSPLN